VPSATPADIARQDPSPAIRRTPKRASRSQWTTRLRWPPPRRARRWTGQHW